MTDWNALRERLASPAFRREFFRTGIDVPLGNQLRFIRLCAGLAQHELAAKAQASTEDVQLIEDGNYEGPIGIIGALAAALDVAVSIRFVPVSEMLVEAGLVPEFRQDAAPELTE